MGATAASKCSSASRCASSTTRRSSSALRAWRISSGFDARYSIEITPKGWTSNDVVALAVVALDALDPRLVEQHEHLVELAPELAEPLHRQRRRARSRARARRGRCAPAPTGSGRPRSSCRGRPRRRAASAPGRCGRRASAVWSWCGNRRIRPPRNEPSPPASRSFAELQALDPVAERAEPVEPELRQPLDRPGAALRGPQLRSSIAAAVGEQIGVAVPALDPHLASGLDLDGGGSGRQDQRRQARALRGHGHLALDGGEVDHQIAALDAPNEAHSELRVERVDQLAAFPPGRNGHGIGGGSKSFGSAPLVGRARRPRLGERGLRSLLAGEGACRPAVGGAPARKKRSLCPRSPSRSIEVGPPARSRPLA